ncbi:MAG: VCBS repeat-containing protein [Fibrobacter sp.]|nr:VCBS repeat-containing protein [Fibrobacter sp.]
MKKILGLGLLMVSLAYSEYVSSVVKAHSPEETYFTDGAYSYAPAIVYHDGVFHQFYCSTGTNTDIFFFHKDDSTFNMRKELYMYKFLGSKKKVRVPYHGFMESCDHIRYRTSKNGSSWSPARVVMTQTVYSSKNRQKMTCDPAITRGDDGYWYLYYQGETDDYAGTTYISRSKTIGGPYLTLDSSGNWERWPERPVTLLRKKIDPTYKDKDRYQYGVGQISVVKKDGVYHFWVADHFYTKNDQGEIVEKMFVRHTTSTSPTNLRLRNGVMDTDQWKKISIEGRTSSKDLSMNVVEFGEVRYNASIDSFEMWLLSKCMGANMYFLKYRSKNGNNWERIGTTNHFGGPYYDLSNLGVSGDENGWIYDRYILSFAGPTLGVKKKASDFQPKDRYGNDKLYASFPWAMYQMIVGDWQTSSIQINYKEKFPNISSKKIEYISGDFDGDGVTDLAAVDRSYNSTKNQWNKWYIRSSQSGQKGVTNVPWGFQWAGMSANHTIVTGDYDGDGKTDLAIVDKENGSWYVISSRTGGKLKTDNTTGIKTPDNKEIWGWIFPNWDKNNSQVLAGDYDGDRATDFAMVNISTNKWYVYSSRTGKRLKTDNTQNIKTPYKKEIWGWNFPNWDKKNSKALVGDYDKDGITDFGMVNVSSKKWYIFSSQTGDTLRNIGNGTKIWGWDELEGLSTNSIITTGDYNGDGAVDLGYVDWSQGFWFYSSYNPFNPTHYSWDQMKSDMINVPNHKVLEGDYDGDGATDRAFVNLDNQEIYIYSSVRNSKGINQDIKHVYPFSKSAVLKKQIQEEKDIGTEIAPIANVARVSVDGSKLSIVGANIGDKVSIMDAQGRMVSTYVMSRNDMTVQLPSTGVYIVRVGSTSHKVAIK